MKIAFQRLDLRVIGARGCHVPSQQLPNMLRVITFVPERAAQNLARTPQFADQDQKGGAAAMVTGGRILKEMGYDGAFSVYFTFTVMEEDCDGLCWNYLIEQEKLVPDYAVITEPTNLGVYRGHRGRMEIEVYFKGRSAHGSAPERGDNAVYKAGRAGLEGGRLNGRLAHDEFLGKGTVAATYVASPVAFALRDSGWLHDPPGPPPDLGRDPRERRGEIEQVVEPGSDVVVPVYERASHKGTTFPQDKYFPTWRLEGDPSRRCSGRGRGGVGLRSGPAGTSGSFPPTRSPSAEATAFRRSASGRATRCWPTRRTRRSRSTTWKASAFYARLPYVLAGAS